MKKTILMGATALSMAVLLNSCSEDWSMNSSAGGRIAPLVGIDTETVTSRSADASSRADGSVAITADDLSLRLTQVGGDNPQTWSWTSISEFDTSKQFPVGEYVMDAFYGDDEAQGFDCPAYFGSASLMVADEKTTSLALTASLSKSMITLKYTDAFEGYMTDWSATVNGVEYIKGEERPVYVKAGNVDIKVTVTKPNGLNATFSLGEITTKARYHYVVTVDVNDGQVGDAAIEVTFDENLELDERTIDISDKVLSTPAPEVTTEGFTSGEPINIISGLRTDYNPILTIMAQAGLGQVWLKTSSDNLLSKGWPENIDLIAATAEQQAKLQELGLDVLGLWTNPDKMAQIDFTGVLANIRSVEGSNSSTFTITVVDIISRASEDIVLGVDVESINIELVASDQKFIPGEEFSVGVNFNGLAEDLTNTAITKFEYFHPVSKTWKNIDILDVTAGSRASKLYTVTFKAPDFYDDLQMRLTCVDVAVEETVESVRFEASADDNNAFANYAYMSVAGKVGFEPDLDNVTVLVKAAGDADYTVASATVEGEYLKVALNPATTYEVCASIDGIRGKAISITTEAATQLANGDMESWTESKVSSGLNSWTNYTPGGNWATLNDLSLSKRTSTAVRSAAESTLSTTDAHSGKAANIRTVGYGAATTFSSSTNYMAGELFLGSYKNSAASYGTEFVSRPASVSFWYKYAPFNSGDKGLCEVKVLDAAGNVIASGTLSLAEVSSYTQQTISLNYSMNTAKAASISVRFRSSDSDTYLNKNGVNSITNGNTSKKFIGSNLYVDDIQLIY